MNFERSQLLFIILGGFFICNAIIAEFLGVKIFALEDTLGIPSFAWNLFNQSGSLNFTAGVLLWPIVFLMTDIINEYYGQRGVKLLSYLTVSLIIYAFGFAYLAIKLTPATWWITIQANQGVPDMQAAYSALFGQGMWIIAGSTIAFLIGQIIDVMIFQRIRKITGERWVWARATGSTLISQFIDSFVVLYIAFVFGPQHWSFNLFLAVGTVNYLYKFIVALGLIPLLYFIHFLIRLYLGSEISAYLINQASAAIKINK